MASGKSTVGKLLAQRLDMEFLDTDELIERRHGPIPRIFEELGEAEFRSMEHFLAVELSYDSGFVISTGGGFMINPKNAELLKRNNRVFTIVAPFEELYKRINAKPASRPLASRANRKRTLRDLFEQRRDVYESFECVGSTGTNPNEVVDKILELL